MSEPRTVAEEISRTDEERRRVCALIGYPYGGYVATWRVLAMAADEIERLRGQPSLFSLEQEQRTGHHDEDE